MSKGSGSTRSASGGSTAANASENSSRGASKSALSAFDNNDIQKVAQALGFRHAGDIINWTPQNIGSDVFELETYVRYNQDGIADALSQYSREHARKAIESFSKAGGVVALANETGYSFEVQFTSQGAEKAYNYINSDTSRIPRAIGHSFSSDTLNEMGIKASDIKSISISNNRNGASAMLDTKSTLSLIKKYHKNR